MTDRIIYLNSELFYYKEGNGAKTILLFHGFGQDHYAFENWVEALKDEYTIYAFDLFFHGNSRWEHQRALKKDDWRKILLTFFDQEKIKSFEIAGFSIGGKFVLTALELFPDRVKKVILIAPDGIKTNFWYGLATSTTLMRSLFKNMILKPNRLKGIIKILKFFHIEDQNLLRFVEFQLNTEEKRKRVYYSWVYFRHLKSNLTDLRLLLNSYHIPVIFILGKNDIVIKAEKIKMFARTINNSQIQVIDARHHDLISETVSHVTQ